MEPRVSVTSNQLNPRTVRAACMIAFSTASSIDTVDVPVISIFL